MICIIYACLTTLVIIILLRFKRWNNKSIVKDIQDNMIQKYKGPTKKIIDIRRGILIDVNIDLNKREEFQQNIYDKYLKGTTLDVDLGDKASVYAEVGIK